MKFNSITIKLKKHSTLGMLKIVDFFPDFDAEIEYKSK